MEATQLMKAAEHEYVKVWVSHAVMGIAATLAVGLRFFARKKTKASLMWDDWLVVFALLLMWGDFACTIMEHRPFLKGVPPNDLSIKFQSELKLISFVSVFFTGGCEVFARLSIIFLYYRLFSVKTWLGWSLKAFAMLSICWLVTLIFAITFQCKPVAAVVDGAVEGECYDVLLGFLITEIINLALDVGVALLPIKTIWDLNLPLRERIGIVIIFLTAGLVIVTQVIRMVFGYNPDPTSNRSITSLSQLSVWTGLHLGFAIICACLPVLRMYLPKEDGALNTRLKLFYQSVSGWTSRISQSRTTPRTTEQQLPNYASRIAYSGYKVPSSDEIPLRTQSKTLVGSSGREYHQPQTQEYA